MKIISYFKIIRYSNSLMAGLTVFLGFWLSDSSLSLNSAILLVIATICSTGFGNVINDIQDIDSDRISHPDRPLPKGEISIYAAKIYSLLLIAIALITSFSVSILHGTATVLPLALLIIYALILKGTPIAGNFVVAILVAYAILYGALGGTGFGRLLLPASLAFLLNFSREIVKDIQDFKGDQASGVITSAILPKPLLRGLVYAFSFLYLLLLFFTITMKLFGIYYCIISLCIALPVHAYRTILISKQGWEEKIRKISILFKLEMLAGLLALATDKFF